MSTPAINLHDYEALARERLDPKAWAYFSGGAGDEHTARDNEAAWTRLKLLPRVLQPMAGGHTRCRLLGREWPHPLLLAPAAYLRMAHTGGESAAALAAAMQGAGLVLSGSSSTPLESIAQLMLPEATRGPLWFQLYLQHDRGFTTELVRRAEAAGYEALVLTVDAASTGARDRQRRAGFSLPASIKAANLVGMPPPPAVDPAGGLFAQVQHAAPTWDDIAWLQSVTRLPVLLKGVLHEADGRQAAALQVAGLIVSNHGGRTLDTTLATADALPRLAQAVGQDMALLVDGGIRRGTDVLKALALGARAVLIGRPYVYALAAAGAQGVAHVLRLLRDELEIAMVLSGCRTLADIRPELIARA